MDYKIMIFNQKEEFTGNITKLIEAKTYSELNGEDSMTIKTAGKYIEKGYRILCHDRISDKFYEYIVRDIDEYKEDGLVVSEVYAENSIAETLGDFIEDKRNIDKSAKQALEKALENTRWDVGYVPSNNTGTTVFYRTNVRNAINDIVAEYELELETEINYDSETHKIHRKLNLKQKIGENRGARITYTKYIKDIKRRTLSDEIFTALYGFGKGEETSNGGYGRRISFADINSGKGYVENKDALERYGRIGKDGKKIHSFGKVEFDNVTDKELLKEKTEIMLEKLSKPSVAYEISINDFYNITKLKEYYLGLGDDVFVIDKDFVPQIRYETRILSIERDLINLEESKIILGELVRNIADTEDEVLENIEDMKEEKPSEWEDDSGEDDGGSSGELPVYEKAADMVKKYPTLKVGLISWIDANESSSLIINGKKVTGIKDAMNQNVVYKQDDLNRAPSTKVIDGRRFVNFNRENMIMRRWPESEGERGRPADTPNQEGLFMYNMLNNKKIKSVTVVYEDRRPMLQSEMFPEDWETPMPSNAYGLYSQKAENSYDVGRQSPLGYPFGAINWDYDRTNGRIVGIRSRILSPLLTVSDRSEYSIAKEYRDNKDKGGVGVNAHYFSKSKNSLYIRVEKNEPDEGHVIAASTNMKYGEYVNMLYIGMSKEKYSDYVAFRSIGGWADEYMFYEMNTFFRGAVAEIILHDRELSISEKRILQEYVEDKYNFDVDIDFSRGV